MYNIVVFSDLNFLSCVHKGATAIHPSSPMGPHHLQLHSLNLKSVCMAFSEWGRTEPRKACVGVFDMV